MPYLGGFLIWFVSKLGFSIGRNSKHSIYIFPILLNVRNLRIEHATWFNLVLKCSLFYQQWDQNNISRKVPHLRWVTYADNLFFKWNLWNLLWIGGLHTSVCSITFLCKWLMVYIYGGAISSCTASITLPCMCLRHSKNDQ